MGKLIGIDDAGRGPVLGPMILAGVLIEDSQETEIAGMGAKDSKLLTPANRRLIKEKIISKYEYHIEKTSPEEIDASTNLNYTEAVKAAMIVNKLVRDLNEKVRVIIDCPSVNLKSWCLDVENLIERPDIVKIICEHKADANHPVVSAASIIAKECREDEVYKLKRELGVDFGSGYPSDPKTKEFIKENFADERYQKLIRFSWMTVKKLIKERESRQEKLF